MISLILPTRGRPERVLTTLRSVAATTDDYELLVAFDEDDIGNYDIAAMQELASNAKRFEWWVLPALLGSSRKMYRIQEHARGEWLTQLSDDWILKTPGWQDILERECPPDRIVCICPADRPVGWRGPEIPIITREVFDLVGYYPNHFYHFFGDTWIRDICARVGRERHVTEIVFHHLHAKYGLAPIDQTYHERGFTNTARWHDTEPERIELANKLRGAMSDDNRADRRDYLDPARGAQGEGAGPA